MLSDDLCQDSVDLTGHVRGITTDVEVGLLLEELVDLFALLLEEMLHIDLVWPLPRERGVHHELVTHGLLILLHGLLAYRHFSVADR